VWLSGRVAASPDLRYQRHEQNATREARLQSTRARRVFWKTPGPARRIPAYRTACTGLCVSSSGLEKHARIPDKTRLPNEALGVHLTASRYHRGSLALHGSFRRFRRIHQVLRLRCVKMGWGGGTSFLLVFFLEHTSFLLVEVPWITVGDCVRPPPNWPIGRCGRQEREDAGENQGHFSHG
jgi:hypothetical protein